MSADTVVATRIRVVTPSRVRVLVLALAVVAVAYNVLAFHRLVADVPGSYPIDLRLRWIEHRLLADRLNPQVLGHPDPDLPESHARMRTQGGSYPPWAYTIGSVY